MVTDPSSGTSKSAFVREVFRGNPEAKDNDVAEAWKAAGNEGTISPSLISKIKKELSLTGRGAGRGGARSGGAKGRKPGTATRGRPKSGRAAGSSRRASEPAGERNGLRASGEGAAGPAVSTPTSTYEELEADIDRMLLKTMNHGGMAEIEEALRRVRRLVVRSHEG